jgi:hypothetical protein
MSIRRIAGSIIVLALTATVRDARLIAQDTTQRRPEVARTVEALSGHWTFMGEGTDSRGGKPAAITMTFDCRKAALGAAVACTLSGTMEGFGPIEAATIVGFNPDDNRVYWMEISSTGEYHTHLGQWSGDAIDFDPLTFTAGGVSNTETFSLRFPSKGRFVLKSTSRTAQGSSTIEGTATRRTAPPK